MLTYYFSLTHCLLYLLQPQHMAQSSDNHIQSILAHANSTSTQPTTTHLGREVFNGCIFSLPAVVYC